MKLRPGIVVMVLVAGMTCQSCMQESPTAREKVSAIFSVMDKTIVESNIVYKNVDSTELKLDVYRPAKQLGEEPWVEVTKDPKPTLIYFHGGGWGSGDRISRELLLLPYIEKGWCVVNVDYRLLGKTNLTGCIEDCMSAVEWTFKHAQKYQFDTTRVVVSGESAGGHLALMTGMVIPKLTRNAKEVQRHKIAAIVNWYGITDLFSAVDYWKAGPYLDMVNLDFEGNTEQLYKIASPVKHISPVTPPVLSVHGEDDENIPFEQAELLHRELDKAGIDNKLVPIPGKKHGNFSPEEMEMAYEQIWVFLDKELADHKGSGGEM